MAGLCEGGNEPPGSLKAIKCDFDFVMRDQHEYGTPKTIIEENKGNHAPTREVSGISSREYHPRKNKAVRLNLCVQCGGLYHRYDHERL
ncbi:hypothetical protein ANN_07905 [Periplaneta americana]|uniref:HNH endonuclease n=1 Tax=Periplaneta americana TaxID=6978 RepID=A0ABQ8T1G3_PERAM|nr:hypothetical protein ANN_07905 [Periplaneta americana]